SPRGLRQAEIPDDRAVVSEHHVALVRRPDGEAAAALDVGILFARQLGRPPIELELARRFWPQLGHAMPSSQRRAPVPRAPELSAVLSDRDSVPRMCCRLPPMWRRPSTIAGRMPSPGKCRVMPLEPRI